MTFIDYFKKQVLKNGPVPFAEFMQAALYAPNIGYYSSGLPVLGKHGDFITAPELTPLFGKTLGNQCHSILASLNKPIILEVGPGSGRLCIDILKRLEQLGSLPDEYWLLDVSGHLKQRQHDAIQREIPSLLPRIKWLSEWPKSPFNGVILANEVLDAMPVHRFLQTEQGLLESHVGIDENSQFQETFPPCHNAALAAHVHRILPRDQYPYLSEANLYLDGWFQSCFEALNVGVVLILDYGFPRHEYYHPDRHYGTLMCHYQHQTHANPLAHPGEEDITAHVDFTHVAEAADQAGFHVAGYTNQASFLLNNGLLDLLVEAQARDPLAQQGVKQLIQPTEMGELFKVMALTKQIDSPLTGFQLHDKRVSL